MTAPQPPYSQPVQPRRPSDDPNKNIRTAGTVLIWLVIILIGAPLAIFSGICVMGAILGHN